MHAGQTYNFQSLPLSFLGELQLMQSTNTPCNIYENKRGVLECVFKGWPLPRVDWYKNDQPIINGSEGFYHTQERSETDQETLHYFLHIPPGREEYEGHYTCNGWSSKHVQSSTIQVVYSCK